MLRWFPRLQVATACFSCSPPDLNFLDPYFIFMYMHYNHCHQVTAHLQLNIYYVYYYYKAHVRYDYTQLAMLHFKFYGTLQSFITVHCHKIFTMVIIIYTINTLTTYFQNIKFQSQKCNTVRTSLVALPPC